MASKITIKTIADPKIWEKFLHSHPESNFLQSYYHGQTNQQINKKVFYSGFYQKSKLIGVSLAILEPARRGQHLIIPGGPILNWNNISLIQSWKKHIIDLAVQNHCVFIRVRPQLEDNHKNQLIFKKLGFIKAPMHLSAQTTLQLNLNQTKDQILSQMRKNTRYEINKSQKLGIKVTSSTSKKDLQKFLRLQTDTANRQKFIPFPNSLIESEFKSFSLHQQALIYSAYYQKKLLAQALIIHFPTESSYHFGASTIEGRKYPGAYAIQWQAIQDAIDLKIPRYNFWGIVEENQTNHRFYGVSVFKRGFGGYQLNYLPARDLIINYPQYLLTYILETFRRKIRKL